ncbi:hypothetical protein Tco_0952448 [Tanacetum coccineum]|uniref:Reverse transcriptase domain-containing protein n=1 Tax=Tanacetum coccineum TaxID=301880 RepID=A0ABQ5DXL1_9ASTR
MPPRMTTQSAGQETAAPRGGRTGGRTGRRGGRTRGRSGSQGSDQGNGRNQNGDAVNENIQGDVRNIIENNDRKGCTYNEFLACNPKEYDGKGGVIVYTRWIKKMRSVQDMSRCRDNQKVKYIAGLFVGKDLTWWNSQIHTRGREAVVGMSWEDFKTLTMEEFFPSNEMQKLEIKLWNHAMVGAGHAALLTSNNPRFIMDDPNITMKEYIRLQEEKAQRHGRTFNWQTATYGKMKYYEEEDDSFTNFETEYPAIVFDDTSDATLSCEPTVSPLNENEIDFRIPFDESDDKDYMVIFDENSFSYKIISMDNLKTDSENENDKVNTPSSPEPMISHCDDLDFFKVFENEFPTITYNDDLTSKLTEPSASFQYIKEFDLINKTSLSKYDEEELKVFNDSFPLNIVFPNNLKSKKDIDDDKIGVTQSSGRNAINIDTKGSVKLLKKGHDMAPLPSRDQRHPWLRFQVEGYTENIVHNYEQRLETIWGRSVNRVYVLDFSRLTEGMKQTLGDRLRMVYTGDEGHELFTSHAWRRLFEIRAPLVREFILEFLSTCRMSDTEMGLDVDDTLSHFGLVSDQRLRGLSMVTHELPLIDLHELGRLNICVRVGDTWAWLALRPERQPDAAAGAPTAAEDAPAFDKGAQADPAPVHAPQPPLPPGLYSRGFPSSRRRCRSYDGALWGCEEMLIYRSLIRAGLLPGWSVA